jgi:hypothetical protein
MGSDYPNCGNKQGLENEYHNLRSSLSNPHRCPKQPNLTSHYENVKHAMEEYHKNALSVAVAIDILERERSDLCFACDLNEAMQVVEQCLRLWHEGQSNPLC